AEGDVADELLPDELVDVVEGGHGEARAAPDVGHALDTLAHGRGVLAETQQLHAVVVHVAGRLDRGPEAAGDADHHRLLAQHAGHALDAAQAVLDRQDDGLRTDQRRRRAGRVLDLARFRGDDEQVDLPGIARVRAGLHAHDAVAAGAGDAQ